MLASFISGSDIKLALRGLLFLYKSNRQRRAEPVSDELTEAIREVTDRLEALGVNLDTRPQAPGELFEHYLHGVSTHWKWLKKFSA